MFVKITFPGEIFAPSIALLRAVLMLNGRRSAARRAPEDTSLRGLGLLIAFEAMTSRGISPASAPIPDASPDGVATLTLDLTSGQGGGEGATLRALFNGQPGLPGLVSAILASGPVRTEIVGDANGRDGVWASGVTEATRPLSVTQALRELVLRLGDIVGVAMQRIERGCEPEPVPAAERINGGAPHMAAFALQSLGRRIASRLDRVVRHPDHWSVRWRRCPEADRAGALLKWPEAEYRVLPDDGLRYYADPFLFHHCGRDFLFVEEFPYRTRKAVISVAEIRGNEVTQVRPVIESDVHLSYPQVFEDGGQIWMIPETSNARTVELWRAVEFPDRWEREAVLLTDVDASDATLLRHDGLYWIFAALSPMDTSSRDMLAIYFSASLRGPWQPHPGNPVLIDVRTSRPGGAFYRRGEDLMRVAQNGSGGYGVGLSICRVDRLDREGFAQTPVAQFAPRPDWASYGVHTLNAQGGLEAIDTVSRALRRV